MRTDRTYADIHLDRIEENMKAVASMVTPGTKIMGILDDVVVNAKSAAEAVGKKAGQLVDVSKLRINVAELNAEISKRYEALGEYVYETCRETLAEDAEAVGKMAAETASWGDARLAGLSRARNRPENGFFIKAS